MFTLPVCMLFVMKARVDTAILLRKTLENAETFKLHWVVVVLHLSKNVR